MGNADDSHSNFKKDKYSFDGKVIGGEGEAQIQQMIYEGGPVETAFTVYSDFEDYAGGVYKHVTGKKAGGHAVKMVGWGVDNGVKYWKVANSWNPYWGENGYFRIRRGNNEEGIEDSVVASDPGATWHLKNSPTPPAPPGPSPSPSPSPSPFTPGQCFDVEDQATCEGTADVKTGEQCVWCSDPSALLSCVTKEWGCNGVAI